ncbi:MAG TPA: hypothetical protein VN033_03750 [Vulgatibacter sp.]|nr:hypothetical protein [Vulgatibacter sp.]
MSGRVAASRDGLLALLAEAEDAVTRQEPEVANDALDRLEAALRASIADLSVDDVRLLLARISRGAAAAEAIREDVHQERVMQTAAARAGAAYGKS